MSKHTPGPWYAEDNCVTAVGGTKGVAILEPDPPSDFWGDDVAPETDGEAMKANARLIAAAPDLLEALASAPIIRLGETLEQFRERYYRWHRLIKVPAENKATGEG